MAESGETVSWRIPAYIIITRVPLNVFMDGAPPHPDIGRHHTAIATVTCLYTFVGCILTAIATDQPSQILVHNNAGCEPVIALASHVAAFVDMLAGGNIVTRVIKVAE